LGDAAKAPFPIELKVTSHIDIDELIYCPGWVWIDKLLWRCLLLN